MINKQPYILLLLFSWSSLVFGQADWEKPSGGIEDARIVIEKDKVIKLPAIARRFESIPLELPQKSKEGLQYNIQGISEELEPILVRIRPRTMKRNLLSKLYNGTVQLGFGNYTTPYALVNFGTKRNDEYAFNLNFTHLSSSNGPVLDNKSGAGTTEVNLNGKFFFNTSTIGASLDYRHESYQYYGFQRSTLALIDFDQIKQHLNVINFSIGFEDNNLKNSSDYKVNGNLNYLADRFDVSEVDAGLDFNIIANLDEQWSLSISGDLSVINQKDNVINSVTRRYLAIKPVLQYKLNDFFFEAGVGIFNDNDSLSSGSSFHVYPHLAGTYAGLNNAKLSAKLSGSVEKVTLGTIYDQNLFLDSHVSVNHNLQPVAIEFNIDGNVNKKLAYNVAYEYRSYDRVGYFVNTVSDTSRFNLVYDQGNSSRNRLFGSLNIKFSDQVKLGASGSYYSYSTSQVIEAWHKPDYDIVLSSDFHIYEPLTISLNLFLLGGISAPGSTGGVVELENITDLNISANYELTERAGVFLESMNILGNNYQVYQNYPVKGFQVIGGFIYKF